jgi:hypothetical protein
MNQAGVVFGMPKKPIDEGIVDVIARWTGSLTRYLTVLNLFKKNGCIFS